MRETVFVLITSAPSEEILNEAKALGVSTMLAKPISFYDLQEHLLYCLLTQGVTAPPMPKSDRYDSATTFPRPKPATSQPASA